MKVWWTFPSSLMLISIKLVSAAHLKRLMMAHKTKTDGEFRKMPPVKTHVMETIKNQRQATRSRGSRTSLQTKLPHPLTA